MRAGYVPIAEIGPELGRLIRERWPHGGGLDVLAEKAGCDQSAIEGIVAVERETAEFDIVDRLLCGVGGYGLWYGRFREIYDGVEFRETCALPGCSVTFPEYQRADGTPVKRYCSDQCRRAGTKVRNNGRPGLRNRKRNRCLRGHKLTPENTIQVTGGRACRKCKNAKRREYHQRRLQEPAYREALHARQREAARRYRARKKAAA